MVSIIYSFPPAKVLSACKGTIILGYARIVVSLQSNYRPYAQIDDRRDGPVGPRRLGVAAQLVLRPAGALAELLNPPSAAGREGGVRTVRDVRPRGSALLLVRLSQCQLCCIVHPTKWWSVAGIDFIRLT